MIIDSLKNIYLYNEIPQNVKIFIKNILIDFALGRHYIDDNNYANIEEYFTKPLSKAKYEAHEKYIDIQFLLSGNEKIYYRDKNGLTYDTDYDSDKDIIFYNNAVNSHYIELDGSNFAVIFPHEAHAPQIQAGNNQENVVKVVVKVKV